MLAARKRPGVRGRNGTTLQEMLVVMAILVSLASSAWPSLRGGLEKGQLRSGAKQVRTELAKTRLTAIESGEAFVFRFQPGTGVFEVAPVSALHADREMIEAENLDGAMDEIPQLAEFELPEGVIFSDLESEESEFDGNQAVESEEAGVEDFLSDADDQRWSAPLVFFPNGRTSNAQIALQNEDGHHIQVTLRGLTGSATVGDLKKAEVEE